MRRNQSDVAVRNLLSEIDNLDAKKKRLAIAQGCQYAREMAEYYEVFDTMKRDMLKQSLIIASINEQQCEAHLQLMRDHRRAEEQFQSTQPPSVDQHAEWATVATEAIRTIGELGKTLLTTQATKQIVKQRAVAAMAPRANEARKATDDEKTARLATVEQTSITVATVQAAATASSSNAAPVDPMAALEALTARLGHFLSGAGGQPPASHPVDEQAVRATDTATIAATASIITASVTPSITPNATLDVTPDCEQSERRTDGNAESSSLAMADGRPSTNATPASEVPDAIAAPTAAMTEAMVTPSVTPKIEQSERRTDGSDEGQLDAKANLSPERTAAPTVAQAAEPQTETAQPDARKSAALTLCQNPYVKSWRSIKSFVRRMTDMDLIVFTSSIPMFRAFLAMLRALTPYYQGPSMSLDELNELAAAPP